MKLRVKLIGLEVGGKPIVVMNKEDAEDLGIRSSARVRVQYSKKIITAIVDVTTKIVGKNFIGVSEEVKTQLGLKGNEEVEVEIAKFPTSLHFIKDKLNGRKLNYEEFCDIVKDTVEGNLNESEIAAFVTALYTKGLNIDEAADLTCAMVENGKTLKLNKKIVLDKHSIGGTVGDKTSMLVVPIIASFGLTIPKTSSRAITSAAGTADKAEVLMPVELNMDEMKEVVEKTNGCIVWGGSLNLAPADDIFIQVEYPLSIDPLMFPSIMGKKKAVGATHLVIDIPTGRGTKIKTIGDADLLAKDFIELGKRLGIKTQCAVTYGEQPIGHAIGPALEAKEMLEVIMRKRNVQDVIDKACHIANMLLKMVGKEQKALEAIKSGKAEEKLREIIAHQGGNAAVKPEDIKIGDYGLDICAERSGYILWINNTSLTDVARAAGAPKDKGAGILLHKKLGFKVEKDERLFTVYAEKSRKLERVKKIIDENNIIGVGDRVEMLIHEVKEAPAHKKSFMLER